MPFILLQEFFKPLGKLKAISHEMAFDKTVDKILVSVCLDISKRYEVYFLEIGTDKDHVHFLLQSVPTKSPTSLVKMIKSITAREIFRRNRQIVG